MAKQLGYRSVAVRGVTEIPGIASITAPTATRDEVDVTDLNSADFEREQLLGFKSRNNAIYDGFYNVGNAVHEQLEEDYNDGLSTPEAWGHRIRHNDTGVVQRTYDYSGTIFACDVGPLATEEGIALHIEIKTTGTITIS
jgi:hypothetical protein